mgnify:CR=1 FL=1
MIFLLYFILCLLLFVMFTLLIIQTCTSFIININLYYIHHIFSHTTCTVYWICYTKTSIQQQRTNFILKHQSVHNIYLMTILHHHYHHLYLLFHIHSCRISTIICSSYIILYDINIHISVLLYTFCSLFLNFFSISS